MKTNKVESFLTYIEERPVYHKVLQELRKKYESLGEGRGSITLSQLTRQEREQLQGMLGINPYEDKKVVIKVKDFESALQQSRFEGITTKMILEAYFQVKLQTKRETKEAFQREFEDTISEFIYKDKEEIEETNLFKIWFTKQINEKEPLFVYLRQKFGEGMDLKNFLNIMQKAINSLPFHDKECKGEKILLPIFAAQVSTNPHYFDSNTISEKVLLDYIKSNVTRQNQIGTAVEEKWELFYTAGLVRDEVTNSILTYGLRGMKKDGSYHKGLEGFYEEKQPVPVTLRTLSGLSVLQAIKNDIYVVENPAIFMHLIETNPDLAVVCTSGQLCLSGLLTLDLLTRNNYKLHYAGDFDPEGLLIADKLNQRYGQQINMWGYSIENYMTALSDVTLSDDRLRKLDSIESKELLDMVACIQKYKKAGYQEKLIAWFDGSVYR